MFHHFHSDDRMQGTRKYNSCINQQYARLATAIYNLDPEEYKTKYLNRTIRDNEICISFDDALKSQIDIVSLV